MPDVRILAPFAGWCGPLEEVPDQVFAGRLVGDGLAVDPIEGILVAPCEGEIMALAPTGHAVSIRAAGGAEILVHLGIDTVQLGGRGFDVRTAPGARVRAGDELIRFDLDLVARGARSLMTPILHANPDGGAIRHRRAPGFVQAGELLFEIAAGAPGASASARGAASEVRQSLVMELRQGLHARPAALIAQRLKPVRAEVTVSAGDRHANARSVVALMALGIRHGDTLTLRATGEDAAAALQILRSAIEAALRIERDAGHSAPPPPAVAAPPAGRGELRGAIAVAGFAVGPVARIRRPELAVLEPGRGVAVETAELGRAQRALRHRLLRMQRSGGAERGEIIAAHVEFLADPALNDAARELIARGKSAAFAWRQSTRRQVDALRSLADARLRERADDLLDVEAQLLGELAGRAPPAAPEVPAGSVLVAGDLMPSELNAIERGRLAAIGLGAGGVTSHVAILAAALDLPMLVGLGTGLAEVPDAALVIVDAESGVLRWDLSEADAAAAERAAAQRRHRRGREREAAAAECRTGDGRRIEAYANLGSTADAALALSCGAEGCGLLRTEFLFTDRDTAPDEEEQRGAYQAVVDAMLRKPVVLRLMDIGGDKPLKYLPQAHEDNPALGLRGIRTAMQRPDLLHTQLRAALRVEPAGVVQLLIPMVTEVSEVHAVRAVVDALCADLGRTDPVRLGAMIETPAAALLAPALLRAVDFISIGSNDLTQYTLAMDRGHAELAARSDALHPAVLRLMGIAAAAATDAGKPVAVCGAIAADRLAVPVLIGLGVTELSVVPTSIPAVKRQIAGLRVDDCRDLARRCTDLESAAQVRDLVRRAAAGAGGAS